MNTPLKTTEIQELWKSFSPEEEEVFWKKYEKFINRAKSQQSTYIQHFNIKSNKVKLFPTPTTNASIMIFNSVSYFPWLKIAFRIFSFLFAILLVLTIPDKFWVALILAIIGEALIRSHQMKQINFEIHLDKLVVGNRKPKRIPLAKY